MTTLAKSSFTQLSALIFLGTSGAATLFLFYIDEGNYSLDNLFALGNMIALSFYYFGIYFTQLFLYTVFTKNLSQYKSLLVSILLGFPIGTVITASLFYSWKIFMVG